MSTAIMAIMEFENYGNVGNYGNYDNYEIEYLKSCELSPLRHCSRTLGPFCLSGRVLQQTPS